MRRSVRLCEKVVDRKRKSLLLGSHEKGGMGVWEVMHGSYERDCCGFVELVTGRRRGLVWADEI
jgi:hypothetical protein